MSVPREILSPSLSPAVSYDSVVKPAVGMVTPTAAGSPAHLVASPSPITGLSSPGFVPPPVPVAGYGISDKIVLDSANRVQALATATSDATYVQELTGSRVAAARARVSATEAAVSNLSTETRQSQYECERTRQIANQARRAVDNAALVADRHRYKCLDAEKKLISVDAKRQAELGKVLRLEAETNAQKSEVEFSHRCQAATDNAFKTARDSVSISRDSVGSAKSMVSRSKGKQQRAASLLQESYAVVNEASNELSRYSTDLVHASAAEREAILRKENAKQVENAASRYLTTVDPFIPDSPTRRVDAEFALHDLETARLADKVADANIAEARHLTAVSGDRLKMAESRLVDADATARISDMHLQHAAVEMATGKSLLNEQLIGLERAKMIERETHLNNLRSKERVVLNAQRLARKRATLKRAKDKLKGLNKTAEIKRKEALRQAATSQMADRVVNVRIEKEKNALMRADRTAARTRQAQSVLTDTQVQLLQAKSDETSLTQQHELAALDAHAKRREMEREMATLTELEQLSPRNIHAAAALGAVASPTSAYTPPPIQEYSPSRHYPAYA